MKREYVSLPIGILAMRNVLWRDQVDEELENDRMLSE